jgi:hypothetical protein
MDMAPTAARVFDVKWFRLPAATASVGARRWPAHARRWRRSGLVSDTSRVWLLLPLPALALWISAIGYGCLTEQVNIGPDGAHLGDAVRCFLLCC